MIISGNTSGLRKKRARELIAILDNLDTYVESLNAGMKPQQIPFRFVHREPLGIKAIDQSGGGGNLKQTRLYIYPQEDRYVLHLITIGDKRSQAEDIQLSCIYVKSLLAADTDNNKG